jgi:hypothetical protein
MGQLSDLRSKDPGFNPQQSHSNVEFQIQPFSGFTIRLFEKILNHNTPSIKQNSFQLSVPMYARSLNSPTDFNA